MTSDAPEDSGIDVQPDEPGPSAEGKGDPLALLWNGFEDLAARLDATEDTIAGTLDAVSADIADLKHQLAQLLKKEQQDKDIKPRRWATRATRKDWDNLIAWVDRLNNHYSLLDDYLIPPCWPAHPGVVEELAGLWRSWTRTMLIDETAEASGDTSLTAWHDRWLWPALTRMKSGHYRTTNCRDQHQPERVVARPTDRGLTPSGGRPG